MTTTWDTIWIDGPPGSGKTTLIEHLLRSATSYDLAVARVRPGPSGKRRMKASSDADLARYKAVGCWGSAVVWAVPDRSFGDLDEIHGFQDEYRDAHVVLFEGAPVKEPLKGELAVYVLRPLPRGKKLISFGVKVIPRIADESPTEVEGWTARAGHEGVVYGDVYVINVHGDRERSAAKELAEEIRKIRADRMILRSFEGAAYPSRRISVFIVNLADRRDPELTKVLARLKRGFVRRRRGRDLFGKDWFS